MPPLPSPHLRIDAVVASGGGEELAGAIDDAVGVCWIPEECAYRLDNVAELNKVAFTGSILEGEPFFFPFRSFRH